MKKIYAHIKSLNDGMQVNNTNSENNSTNENSEVFSINSKNNNINNPNEDPFKSSHGNLFNNNKNKNLTNTLLNTNDNPLTKSGSNFGKSSQERKTVTALSKENHIFHILDISVRDTINTAKISASSLTTLKKFLINLDVSL